jgi:hypothetical protein
MKVSKVDTVLPFPNREEIGTVVRRVQNLNGAIRRATELYRASSFAGNVKKAEYFSRTLARLKGIRDEETVELNEEILSGLHALKHKVTRSNVTLGMMLEQQKWSSKGQISPLQVRYLQVLCLKGEVVRADGSRIDDLTLVVSASRVACAWLSGELRLADKPVGMTAEQRYYEDYARGY